jgi:hypothetical protein
MQRIAKAKKLEKRSLKPIVVNFKVKNPDDNGPSPYVGLTKKQQKHSLKYLYDPNATVIDDPMLTLVIDYPLRHPTEVTLGPCLAGFTREDLVRLIGSAYRKIYREEKASSTLPVETMARRNPGCSLMNRAETNGKYGIYGHVLDDLLLHTIVYHRNTHTLMLKIDS